MDNDLLFKTTITIQLAGDDSYIVITKGITSRTYFNPTLASITRAFSLAMSIQKTRNVLFRAGYSKEHLENAWSLVEPKNDWKAPIDATVSITHPTQFGLISTAIKFYTATPPTWQYIGPGQKCDIYRVTAAGYRAGPAGDH